MRTKCPFSIEFLPRECEFHRMGVCDCPSLPVVTNRKLWTCDCKLCLGLKRNLFCDCIEDSDSPGILVDEQSDKNQNYIEMHLEVEYEIDTDEDSEAEHQSIKMTLNDSQSVRDRESKHNHFAKFAEHSGAKSRKASQGSSITCAVCLVEPRTILYRPCNHFVACMKCTNQIIGLDGCCPVCRTLISTNELIYT